MMPGKLELMRLGLANGQIPQVLYKYTSTDVLKLILKNKKIKFSRITDFNDKRECFAIQDFNNTPEEWRQYVEGINPEQPRRIIRGILNKLRRSPGLGRQWIAQAIKETNEELGILCLTCSNSNELMWAHYADSQRGVCLEFDLGRSLNTFCFPKRVEYDDEPKRFNYIRAWIERNDSKVIEPIYHKSAVWSYEEEYRVVRINGAGLVPFNKAALRSICFGIDTPEDVIGEIKQLCLDNGFEHVEFRKNTLNPETGSYEVRVMSDEGK